MPALYSPLTPVSPPLKFLYCDTSSLWEFAILSMQAAPYLILDCEGYNLGREGGSATLICMGTPYAEHIFLFDLLSTSITQQDIHWLLSILGDPNILKVVWDGRMDYLEIWSSFGVALEGVLDLQIAEVVSRTEARGEEERTRVERLQRGYLGSLCGSKIGANAMDCLHAVIGLQRCWETCGYPRDVGKDPEVMRMHKNNGCAMWLQRPLSSQLLQYAAKDILLIGVLCPHFLRSGWIPNDGSQYRRLLAQSQRYISAHREQGKSPEDDIFRPCAIVPMDVLYEPVGPFHKCCACRRSLSFAAFETRQGITSSQTTSKPAPVILRRARCRLCSVLADKHGLQAGNSWLLT